MTTDHDSTRDRIREAARAEFAAVGFSGSRVDAIAKRAGCNKQLIYHYFGDKAGLYEAVITAALAERPPVQLGTLEDLADSLEKVYEHHQKKLEWIRLLQWESLEADSGNVVAEDQRRAHLNRACGELEKSQPLGWLTAPGDARFFMIAVMAMMIFPLAFPQMVRLVTGHRPTEPEFKGRYLAVVRGILGAGGKPGA